ncbi:retropepsin-like aspartic protease [Sphingomonas sp. S2-65]|uniref:retropepsin-like aspartic protease n=1 Tax=Sphingomonas sp. S2-65 TaxID=2903960 RepID=UPI001F35FDC7|nr:retropepsin-like aspartic protease [Sphingomonas sp. S2-65]UYY56851.1 retroviral-like aspartic protease family protein [Sphingomonas sp. S2-65]
MARVLRPLLLVFVAAASTAWGQDVPVAEPSPEAVLLALETADARLTVPVAVGERGPYNFIIDTGAERSVVSRELARILRLEPGKPVSLTSMTGTERVDTVIVPDLTIRTIGRPHRVIAPALFARHLGAAGLLGIDTLRDHQVSIDFERNVMAVQPSSKRAKRQRRGPDEIVVTAKSLFGQLIVTDAFYGSTRIRVVLDTGSAVTIGNEALRRRIGRRAAAAQPISLTSVTGDTTYAAYTMIPNISVGRVQFGSLPVAFADVAPFHRFGLAEHPALLLGMDALRSFRRVDIDFANRQVRFVMPKDTARPGARWSWAGQQDWRPR